MRYSLSLMAFAALAFGQTTLSPSSFTFTAIQGVNPPTQTLQIVTNDILFIAFPEPSWILWDGSYPNNVGFTGGIFTSTHTVGVNVEGLVPGTYNGSLQFNDISCKYTVCNSSYATDPSEWNVVLDSINITLTITGGPPVTAVTFDSTGPLSSTFPLPAGWGNPGSILISPPTYTFNGVAYTTPPPPYAAWLQPTLSNSTPVILTLLVNPVGLGPGTYTCAFAVGTSSPDTSTVTVDMYYDITLTVTSSQLIAAPPRLTFAVVQGGSTPTPQDLVITATPPDGGWLNESPAPFINMDSVPQTAWPIVFSGTTTSGLSFSFPGTAPITGMGFGQSPATVSICPLVETGTCGSYVSNTFLSVGSYSTSIVLSTDTGDPALGNYPPETVTVPLTLTVIVPALVLSTSQLQFQCSTGLSNATPQTMQVQGTAATSLDASITVSVPWLVTSVKNAVTPFNLNIQPDCAALTVGNYTGMVVVKDMSFRDSQTVNVTLTVGQPILSITDVTNAALPSLDSPPNTINLAPRSMATIFGTNLADIIASSTSPWTSPLGGTEVHLASDTCFESSCDLVAKLIYVSPAQVNFLVPDITVVGPTPYRIVFVRDSQRIDDQSYLLGGPGRVIIDPSISADHNVVFQIGYDCLYSYSLVNASSCGLSWINGGDRALTGAVTDASSGQLISSENPIYQGRLITLWMTALYGGVTLSTQTGLQTGNIVAPVAFGVAQSGNDLTTGFMSPTPLWAGESPQFVGLDQVNVAFPGCTNPPATNEKRYDAFLSYTSLETGSTVRIYLPFIVRPGDPDCQW
jgi:hypothetical protein